MNNRQPERIWLCGFMGAGKSTIGPVLSAALDLPFTDMDERIAGAAGCSIPELFERKGEAHFRRLERRMLEQDDSPTGVIALGGGALHDRELVERLKQRGLLIFIDTPFSLIFRRIDRDTGRPLAESGKGNRDRLQQLYRQRLPLYRQAHLQIPVTETSAPEEVVEIMIRKIEQHVSDD